MEKRLTYKKQKAGQFNQRQHACQLQRETAPQPSKSNAPQA
ncbi:MAG TPA: hypothetical protein V6C95_21275 [Coleofasciculaceae cyanobacterium]